VENNFYIGDEIEVN